MGIADGFEVGTGDGTSLGGVVGTAVVGSADGAGLGGVVGTGLGTEVGTGVEMKKATSLSATSARVAFTSTDTPSSALRRRPDVVAFDWLFTADTSVSKNFPLLTAAVSESAASSSTPTATADAFSVPSMRATPVYEIPEPSAEAHAPADAPPQPRRISPSAHTSSSRSEHDSHPLHVSQSESQSAPAHPSSHDSSQADAMYVPAS